MFPRSKKRKAKLFRCFLRMKEVHIIPGSKEAVNLLFPGKPNDIVYHIGIHIRSKIGILLSFRIWIVIDDDCICTHFLRFLNCRFKVPRCSDKQKPFTEIFTIWIHHFENSFTAQSFRQAQSHAQQPNRLHDPTPSVRSLLPGAYRRDFPP